MEKKGARLFQQETGTPVYGWNIVELESRRQLRQKINELIGQSYNTTLTTSEMREQFLRSAATFGNSFAAQLVRSLQRDDQQERQSIVWLLTLLNDAESVAPLQHMSRNPKLPRPVRLSASLALAGMGMTPEIIDSRRQPRLYAIS